MIRIGIADDDALVRHVLSTLLDTQEDISVAWTACDGSEALQLLKSPDHPAVRAILLDIQMPQMDGVSLATIVQDELPETAILILTTFTEQDLVERALAAGVNGFIAKEDPVESVAGAIRQAVEGNLVLSPSSSRHLRETENVLSVKPTRTEQAETTPTRHVSGSPEFDHLSQREIDVLALMAEALPNKQIARRLSISEATVKTHVSTLIAKLGVHDRVGAVVKAVRSGIV